jgi:hypothetical protein
MGKWNNINSSIVKKVTEVEIVERSQPNRLYYRQPQQLNTIGQAAHSRISGTITSYVRKI